MHIVLDTNIIVSAHLWGGVPRSVLEEVHDNHTLCFTEKTLNELRVVLSYKKFLSDLAQQPFSVGEILDQLTEQTFIVPDLGNPITVIREDPSDNAFLECALASHANYIVSGDRHLLKLRTFESIPIVTPREFLNRIKVK